MTSKQKAMGIIDNNIIVPTEKLNLSNIEFFESLDPKNRNSIYSDRKEPLDKNIHIAQVTQKNRPQSSH